MRSHATAEAGWASARAVSEPEACRCAWQHPRSSARLRERADASGNRDRPKEALSWSVRMLEWGRKSKRSVQRCAPGGRGRVERLGRPELAAGRAGVPQGSACAPPFDELRAASRVDRGAPPSAKRAPASSGRAPPSRISTDCRLPVLARRYATSPRSLLFTRAGLLPIVHGRAYGVQRPGQVTRGLSPGRSSEWTLAGCGR